MSWRTQLNSSLPSLFAAPLPCPLWSNHSIQRRSKFYTRNPCSCLEKNCYPASCCSFNWYSEEIYNLKKHRRRLERRRPRTKLPADRQLFIDQCRAVNNFLCSSKKSNYTSQNNNNQSDYRLVFKTTDNLLHRNCDTSYPPCNSLSELANKFVEFFSDKITKIRVTLDAAAPLHSAPEVNRVCPYTFDEFSNSNWTSCRTIQGVIARGRFEITSTITPWIVRHEVQLLINRIYNKFRN